MDTSPLHTFVEQLWPGTTEALKLSKDYLSMEQAAKYIAAGTFFQVTPSLTFEKVALNIADAFLLAQFFLMASDSRLWAESSQVSLTGSNFHLLLTQKLEQMEKGAGFLDIGVPRGVLSSKLAPSREWYFLYLLLCSCARSAKHQMEFDSILGARVYDIDPQKKHLYLSRCASAQSCFL